MTNSPFSNYQIIVHSHLGWDWVWQRPQQFLSRLSKRHRVLFVEGPRLFEGDGQPSFELCPAKDFPQVTIMRTHFPEARFNDGQWVDAQRARLLDEVLAGPLAGKFERPVQWFYDPMAYTAHAGKHGELLAVYDCMDELSKFKFAPPELVTRERQLLAHAKVVFAGGRKMWESKSRHNDNAHFYGCGVEIEHFGSAMKRELTLPEDVRHLEGPILGYIGVVDERLDYDLIAQLADANANWNVVIVGPVCKVDASQFPQRDNLHWMGGRDYEDLPRYCKAFDICLMPFAMNEATQYINPTKALEYMASGTPVVSTPVPDVVSNFSSAAHIGLGQEFIDFCQKLVDTPDELRVRAGLKLAAQNTWDDIVAKMEKHIEAALGQKTVATAPVKAVSTLDLSLVGRAA